jgi:nitroreductase
VDAYLAIASKRDVKTYADRLLAAGAVDRILDAGRLSGSARNRQPWRFVVVEDGARRERLAQAVYAPDNLRTAALVVAVVATGAGAGFDCGRAAQNMMLAAWNDGIGSSPNGLADRDAARQAIGLDADAEIAIVLSFGYPARPREPGERSVEEWSTRANRKPLEEIVRRA